MNYSSLKYPAIMLLICGFIGVLISHYSKIHWLPASLTVLFAILFNGVAISVEDHQPGGWDHIENETPEQNAAYKKMLRRQGIITVIVFVLAISSYVATSS